MNIQIIPIRSHKVIESTDVLLDVLFESMKKVDVDFEDGDILVVTSKVVSVTEGKSIQFSKIKVSDEANKLSKKSNLPPEFVQIILDESDSYTGIVPGAITTLNKYGLLPNAGVDMSNAGANKVIAFPKNPKESAKLIFESIQASGTRVGVIIADSRMTPLRSGTVGSAVATYGFLSIIDERGKNDLFGRPMTVTTRAVADQLTTAAELVMGETDERIPFTIIRNYPLKFIDSEDEVELTNQIAPEDCMFMGPFIKGIKK
ncbi:MAG: coenzyme F420-0:L-glutamate ligase [Candidatus Altiarchaeota archaeon]|nr:coenzyme F420-0:L-glutamate ligase [Candidatus Altiarchaeota archaeon]